LKEGPLAYRPWPSIEGGLFPCIAGCTDHVDVNGVNAVIHLLTCHADAHGERIREACGLTEAHIRFVLEHSKWLNKSYLDNTVLSQTVLGMINNKKTALLLDTSAVDVNQLKIPVIP
jgi:hypothetical protein